MNVTRKIHLERCGLGFSFCAVLNLNRCPGGTPPPENVWISTLVLYYTSVKVMSCQDSKFNFKAINVA